MFQSTKNTIHLPHVLVYIVKQTIEDDVEQHVRL